MSEPLPVAGRSWKQEALACSALLALVLAVFWPVLSNGFVDWDDPDLILQNPDLNAVRWGALAGYWRHPAYGLYAPLTYTAYGALAQLSRSGGAEAAPLDPRLFHAFSLALHAGSCLLAWLVLRAVGVSRVAALLCAALFAVHPLQVEPVAWASSLNTVLSGCLGLGALWLFGNGARWRFGCATGLYVLALCAKPSAIVLPLIAGALDLAVGRFRWRRVMVWCLLAVPFVLIGRAGQSASIVTPPSLLERPLVALHAIGFYIVKLFAPTGMTIDYGLSPERVLWTRSMWYGVGVSVALFGALAVSWRRAPRLAAGIAMFVAGFLPVLGLMPFDFQRYSTVADRYAYLSLLGAALAAGAMLKRWPGLGVALFLGVGACAVAAHRQSLIWRDTTTLARHALDVNPTSLAGHKIAGRLLARTHRIDDAMEHYRAGLRTRPDDPDLHFNLANLLLSRGEWDRAIDHYGAALVRRPKDARIYNNLGIALAEQGDLLAACASYRRAIAIQPSWADPHANLGSTLLRRGQGPEAVAEYRVALALDPANAIARRGLERATSRPAERP